MPNWTESKMGVILPKDKVDLFLSRFIDYDDEENHQYFHRTFYEHHDVIYESDNYCLIFIEFQSAWSIEALHNAPPNCANIYDVCKECGVYEMKCHSIEYGVGFEEEMLYNYGDDDVFYHSYELNVHPDNMCLPDEEEILQTIEKYNDNKENEQ